MKIVILFLITISLQASFFYNPFNTKQLIEQTNKQTDLYYAIAAKKRLESLYDLSQYSLNGSKNDLFSKTNILTLRNSENLADTMSNAINGQIDSLPLSKERLILGAIEKSLRGMKNINIADVTNFPSCSDIILEAPAVQINMTEAECVRNISSIHTYSEIGVFNMSIAGDDILSEERYRPFIKHKERLLGTDTIARDTSLFFDKIVSINKDEKELVKEIAYVKTDTLKNIVERYDNGCVIESKKAFKMAVLLRISALQTDSATTSSELLKLSNLSTKMNDFNVSLCESTIVFTTAITEEEICLKEKEILEAELEALNDDKNDIEILKNNAYSIYEAELALEPPAGAPAAVRQAWQDAVDILWAEYTTFDTQLIAINEAITEVENKLLAYTDCSSR